MDSTRFHRFTKRLASVNSRRSNLKGVTVAGAVSTLGTGVATAQYATPATGPPPEWLLTINFERVEMIASADDSNQLEVTLSGVDSDTT